MKAHIFAASVLVSAAGLPSAANAQTVEQFYQGRTLTIMLGHPPGGSYDLYARLAANHLKVLDDGVILKSQAVLAARGDASGNARSEELIAKLSAVL